jgi:hypothetical protein
MVLRQLRTHFLVWEPEASAPEEEQTHLPVYSVHQPAKHPSKHLHLLQDLQAKAHPLKELQAQERMPTLPILSHRYSATMQLVVLVRIRLA